MFYLVYIEASDIKMYDAGLHILQHAPRLVVLDKVLHDRWGDEGQAIAQDVRLQALQKRSTRDRVRAEPVVDRTKQDITEKQ